MSLKKEHISVRITRLNNLILGNSQATSKACKSVTNALSREGLLDALSVLYNECNREPLKKRDKNISEFVTKYRPVIQETNSLRISNEDFKAKAQIGKGFFGNVYLVEERTTKDIYAMKKIKKSCITNSQVKEERDIMARRDSEWITSLQYAFQDSDYLYLVMEYLPGGDLLSLMVRNGPFDEDLAKFYLAELTLAINALHSMGYVHRDIKPENILIDRFGHIKLADFGNAAALDKDGYATSLSPVGTPDYIAPELLQTISISKLSKSTHDVRCDYWSMGVIGYELIYETTPFHEDSVHDTYSKILSHCDESSPEVVSYPSDVKISPTFKNLLENLIIKPSARLTYAKITKHPFFEDISWQNLRHQVPPIIPTVKSNDDISNFEDIERNKGRKSTFVKRVLANASIKSTDILGKDLPFIGYGFVHEDPLLSDDVFKYDDCQITKLNNKIKELQKLNKGQNEEIKSLQEKLLKAERTSLQSNSLNKILRESKEELNKIKEKLKEKTTELASCRTEIKTLKASLKIEEEMRLKNEATISEVLSSTYQKWEKAKMISDQNYEKQISEKKTEITNITQKLLARENELSTKSEECAHLQKKVENYKEMLKTIKDRSQADKIEFEKAKQQMIDNYETKINDLSKKLKTEKDTKTKLNHELRDLKNELDESICSTNSSKQAKLTTERNMEMIKERLNKEIEMNNNLRSENALIQKRLTDSEKLCDQFKFEIEKLRQELLLFEACKKTVRFEGDGEREHEHASPYQTAHGSLTELSSIEDQLRNDLLIAKEKEDEQRKRADQLENVVTKLESIIEKLKEQPCNVGDIFEKKTEKLEDQLAAAREQAVLERQSARTANLSLWKLEKQVEDVRFEKKTIERKLEVAEQKIKLLQQDKYDIERKLKEAQSNVQQKESKVIELKGEIQELKSDLQKEHKMWEKSEQERMKEKSDNIEILSKKQKIEEKCEELNQKIKQFGQRNDSLNLENKRLISEINEEREKSAQLSDQLNSIQTQLKQTQQNYDMLKIACNVTDTQLTEIEVILETEQKRNKENQEKINTLWQSIREKDEQIGKLKQALDSETLIKTSSEKKIKQINLECENLRKELENARNQIISQQNELITKTKALFECQENNELLNSELSNLQVMNGNLEKQILMLKEENSKILSDLFMMKEEASDYYRELKSTTHLVEELKQEIEQLNGRLREQKNYYGQREVKSEATLAQQKKLIDYLQQTVQNLTQKKKKTLAERLGISSGTPAKENISPNVIESSIMYKNLQEELKKEKQLNKQLREELEKFKEGNFDLKEIFNHSPRKEKLEYRNIDVSSEIKNDKQDQQNVERKQVEKQKSAVKISSPERNRLDSHTSITSSAAKEQLESHQTHYFELTLQNTDTIVNHDYCTVCQKSILIGSPYWLCKECKLAIHRKCRSQVQTPCGFKEEVIIHSAPVTGDSSEGDDDKLSFGIQSDDNNVTTMNTVGNALVLKSNIISPSLEINCVFEIFEDIILIGCKTGLFAYHLNDKTIVQIDGITSVSCITVTEKLSKSIFIGSNGEHLYQCDLRHLQSRSQANACLKPKLDVTILDLPSTNRAFNERWHLVKVSTDIQNAIDTTAIAATVTRILILKYDLKSQKFRAVRALDSAMAVSSILFTRHTAIVSADKFFEIDLSSFAAEEFVDLSDSTLSHTRSCQPMNAFRISPQEFLLCYNECGIFVDEYGCRSRPYDLNWEYIPTGFIYQEPLLYISHFQIIQIIRIHRSFRNEVALTSSAGSGDEDGNEPNFLRAFINLYTPALLAESGKLNVYALSIDKDTNLQELHLIDGKQALKKDTNVSLETLSSQGTCLTLESGVVSSTA